MAKATNLPVSLKRQYSTKPHHDWLQYEQVYSEPYQTFTMELFLKIVNG